MPCQVGIAADETTPQELEVLKAYVGTWDAEIETWPAGPDQPSITVKGVKTNRAYGTHWITSDFEVTSNGRKINVHSIVGYDLDKKQLVGTIIDQGPYAAAMTGTLDPKANQVSWEIIGKMPDGKTLIQRTVVTQKSADERVLVAKRPGKIPGESSKYLEIRFKRRK